MNETGTGGADAGPFAEQQRLFELLSQDTRHLIIQELLGHPTHLMSLAELEYMTGKSQAAIKDQLETLIDAGLLARYTTTRARGNAISRRSSTGSRSGASRSSTTTSIFEGSQSPALFTKARAKLRRSNAMNRPRARNFPTLLRRRSRSTNPISTQSMSPRMSSRKLADIT